MSSAAGGAGSGDAGASAPPPSAAAAAAPSGGDTLDLPVIDLGLWLTRGTDATAAAKSALECKSVADTLHRYGVAIVKDPRVTEVDNDSFLDMMEKYFEQPDEAKDADVRKEVHYQARFDSAPFLASSVHPR